MEVISISYCQDGEEGMAQTLETYRELNNIEKMQCLNDAIYDLVVLKEILKLEMRDFKNDNFKLD